ncbi:hypothetical protein BDN72DRAFT_840045 [Pluteus cervinus]|uniref:Uncharacterized protein n=1 Tax=Pluteus cervinus TaxID=181527 RepID=A0ACD3AUL6_9AGAR|nr:hypothetical protein BDN72DRAFT_840045 [Pluteus cervinus]
MPSLGKFSAWVEVGGKHLPEFSSTVADDMQTVSCWVPSEAGEEFAVCWKDSKALYALEGWVTIDGNSCGGLCHRKWTINQEKSYQKNCLQTSSTAGQAFKFSTIELTDDDSDLRERPGLENLGEIKVELYEVEVLGSTPIVHVPAADTLSANARVHERSKKGMGHCVGLGTAVTRVPTSSTKRKRIRTVATFTFRYRPLAILQANGITPIDRSNKRKASTPPQDSSDDEDEERSARIQALQKELSELEAQKKKKRVKVEVAASTSALRRPKNLGVIDLTDL